MEKKNTMLLTIIAVATLLVVVVGATFAYFTAQNGASGSTTATVTTETIGAITVSNEDPALYLDLTAAQMQEGATGSYWATKIKGAEPATNYASADKAVIAKLNVSGGDETTTYSCNFKITVDKTDVTLAYGDAAVVFALENNAEILGVTSGSEIDYTTLLNEYTVNFTRIGDTEEDLPLVSVSMRVTNTEVEQGFAGETLTTTFTSSDLECEVVDESDVKTLSGTWRFNDELSLPSNGDIDETLLFTSSGENYSRLGVVDATGLSVLYYTQGGASNNVYYAYGNAWEYQLASYQTIYIEQEQEVSSEFYEWFTANAKPMIEVATLPTENIDTSAIYKTYEYTDIDSTNPTTIGTGTYRFNDVLSYQILDRDTVEEIDFDFIFNFAVDGYGIFPINCTKIRFKFYTEINTELGHGFYLSYFGSFGDNDAEYIDVYSYDGDFTGWKDNFYGEETITITSEQEVPDAFGTWFIANAKLRGDAKYYQYVDGSWVEQ